MLGFSIDRMRAIWWVVGAALLAAVVFILYAFVGTFVFALFIYYATRPAYDRIHRRVRHPTIAATFALGVFAVPAIALLAYTLAIGLQELSNLQNGDFGPLLSVVEPYTDVSQIVEDPASLLGDSIGLDTVEATLRASLEYIGFIGNGLLHLFVMLAVAFYLLRDGRELSQWLMQFADDGGVVGSYLGAVDRSLQSVFFGNILNAIVTGAIGAIAFNVLNVFAPPGLAIPYPALTGLLTGIGSLVPVVGMKIVYLPVVGFLGFRAVMDGGGYGFVFAVFAVSLVVVDSLPDFFLRPYVSGRNLHVGLVMFAYILGPVMFGWYGIFLGPLILVVVFHFGRVVLPELLAREPIHPGAVDPMYLLDPTPDGTSDAVATEETVTDGDESADEQLSDDG